MKMNSNIEKIPVQEKWKLAWMGNNEGRNNKNREKFEKPITLLKKFLLEKRRKNKKINQSFFRMKEQNCLLNDQEARQSSNQPNSDINLIFKRKQY